MKINNKAQIHMMETIAVLLVFFILILIGFVFYVKIMEGNIEIEKEEIKQLEAVEIAQRAISLPELQCSQGEEIVTRDCIDTLMLDAFKDPSLDLIDKNQVYYHNILGFSEVFIKEIYPNPNKPILTLYDKHLDEFSDNITTFLPISLKYPKEDKYSFGIVQVNVYIK